MIRALLALPLAVAVTVTAPPQFRASVDVVRIEALVLDKGRPVAGLGAGDFTVTDNGAAQTITVRALARQPIDVAIALDVSSSVRGERLERLRQAAGTLVGLLTPQDRATLVTFDHQVTLGPRDVSPHALDARLAAIVAGGRTALIDAVTTALVWGGGRERPMLILAFSDGRDTASWTRADQALALARSSDAVVDAVVTGELLPTSTARIGSRRHARRTDAGRAVPRRSGRADRRARPQRRGGGRPRRRIPRGARAVSRPLRDHLHRDQQGAGLARHRRARARAARRQRPRPARLSAVMGEQRP